jgi:hypothetical protein
MNGNHDQHHLTRNWDMMLRTRDESVHLTGTSDPTARTSTTVLLDRVPLVEGGEPVLRDTLLVLTTINRGQAYESMIGLVVRKQYDARTVLIMPVTLTTLDRREGHLTGEGLAHAHEEALSVLATRFHDDPDFRTRLAAPA